jgi:pimeloyl-ACP methyl ester carboxylesterase
MRHRKRRLRLAWAALFLCAAAYGLVGWLRPEWVLEAEFARQRWLAGASERSVQVGNHRIRYLVAGHGRTIVLLHGFTGSKENWLPLMRRLAKSYRVIAPDLAGWGESTRLPGADYGPVAQSERLRDLLLELQGPGLYRPPTLVVGHSMGGQILGLLAARHPDAVNRIALVDAAGVPFKPNAFGRAVLAGRNPFEVKSRTQLKAYLDVVFNDPPWTPWPADRALVKLRAPQAGFEQEVLDRIGRGPEALLLSRRLGRIRAPTLLLWCRDDRVIDASAMEVFRAGIRNQRSVLLDDCGHMPMLRQPDATAAAFDAFLRQSPRLRATSTLAVETVSGTLLPQAEVSLTPFLRMRPQTRARVAG